MVRIPTNRPPMHPGRMLEKIIDDIGLTQSKLADLTEMPFQRVNQIVRQRRAVTPDTALRLARLLGTTPDFWLNLQLAWDLYHAREEAAKDIGRIRPLKVSAA
jgi:addiction module HigA family antidote